MNSLHTWVEIDKKALYDNMEQFFNLVPKKTRFMAVIKSNAYGHGLVLIAKALLALRSFSEGGWFGVDSVVEAFTLRREGIKNPILVFGSILSSCLGEVFSENITLTISNFEALAALRKAENRPTFHIKIDTGMHRQGFLPKDIFKLIKVLKHFKLSPQGVYTHFAAVKPGSENSTTLLRSPSATVNFSLPDRDTAYPTYTLGQLRKFNSVVSNLQKAGFKNLIRHAAASGGTLLFPESHLDMVRVGMGLYGYWPSPEVKMQFASSAELKVKNEKLKILELKPVLTWKTIVSEVKEIPAGSFVSYDLTEGVSRKTKIAILPVGYWHGYDRGLSSVGEVLIGGRRRKILGRVTMDMVIVDVTDLPRIKVGDVAALTGEQKKESVWADELALKIGTTPYEFLTRINPLIKRIIV